jgi:hypothetical protein
MSPGKSLSGKISVLFGITDSFPGWAWLFSLCPLDLFSAPSPPKETNPLAAAYVSGAAQPQAAHLRA